MGLVCSNNLQKSCTEFNQCISNGVMLMTSENYDQRWSKGFPSSHPKGCAAVGPPPGAALVWRSRLSARGKETKWALPESRLLWQGLLHLIYSDRLSARLLCLGYSFSGISGVRCVSYPAPCPLHHSEGWRWALSTNAAWEERPSILRGFVCLDNKWTWVPRGIFPTCGKEEESRWLTVT